MKQLNQLQELAQQHGIKTTKRLFTSESRTGKPLFLDVEKSKNELVRELREAGVL